MPQFRYRAITQAGNLVIGEVEAPSREEVFRRIEYLGHLPIEADAVTKGIFRTVRSGGKSPRPRDVTIFLHQLALLVGAGLTLEGALQTLGDDASRGIGRFANALRSSISAGHRFAEALESHSKIIEPAYIAMVRAGEPSQRACTACGLDRDVAGEELEGPRRLPHHRLPPFGAPTTPRWAALLISAFPRTSSRSSHSRAMISAPV